MPPRSSVARTRDLRVPSDAAPEFTRFRGQRGDGRLYLRDELRPIARIQELLDVPRVLRSTAVELEQDNVAGARDRQIDAGDAGAPHSTKNRRLPRAFSDDEIHGSFAGRREPDDTGEWIVDVTAADADGHAAGFEKFPCDGIETFVGERE